MIIGRIEIGKVFRNEINKSLKALYSLNNTTLKLRQNYVYKLKTCYWTHFALFFIICLTLKGTLAKSHDSNSAP